ncbi:MAG: SprT family zinc-dependent metalloprotease [bacterium]|nr:SprT family zinc-dependent metalloprotease [bacterium]
MNSSRNSVAHGKENIEYSLFHVDRKTLEIAVHPDRSVVVKAPLGIDHEAIRTRVAKRAGWIIRQRDFFRQFDPRTPARSFVGGETHLYLGRHYRLKINSGNHDAIKLIKGFFEIQVEGDVSSEKAKRLLEGWYRVRAEGKFRESFDRCWPHFEKRRGTACRAPSKPRLQIRRMQKRWGSLSSKGMLTLNINLIHAPRECIDYVIVHELSHLECNNHNPEFYRFLDKLMPDWEKRKPRLEVISA